MTAPIHDAKWEDAEPILDTEQFYADHRDDDEAVLAWLWSGIAGAIVFCAVVWAAVGYLALRWMGWA